ncbi:hypothetical protein EV385_2083 [Krasilnikovia cinnamomea]|uniref:DUF4185 domain-containing protein n=1 Tax=Krasilnikovia cinnamomea TaxID=349313 RepID=A0A4Q7ZJ92_9ACTN|nr:hypothetical protein [Krasilnikovia cinnamomea]RZU50315.1 hypothetical protein EV385_2083 [Krasilnikovia cinnamomea]
MYGLAVLAAAVVLGAPAAAVPASPNGDVTYTRTLLGKAQPDECFAGIGQPYPPGPPCAQGQPKVNQAYVWSLVRTGRRVWFGTGANTHCLTSGANLGSTQPVRNDDYVCEFGESQVARTNLTIPDALGDVRPPQVWLHDTGTGALVNKSAEISTASAADARRLGSTLGMRAAGTLDGVVLLGGPSLHSGLNLFAFDAATGRFLGSRTLLAYGNARTFLAAEGALYLGVGIGPGGGRGGAVLRWAGNRLAPFTFVKVGALPAQAVDLAYHEGRLVATTWSTNDPATPQQLAGVWTSPPLPLTRSDAGGWTQAWNVAGYEPDPLIERTYGLGGVASYGGWVYWGTMHVPLQATLLHQATYPQDTDEAKRAQIRFTQRATSLWRGRDLGRPTQQIELLYGEPALPAYTPGAGWSPVSTGATPRYGRSGFGNAYNNYTWRMAVAGGRLYVATMDWSYLVHDLSAEAPPTDPALWGADLWAFPSADEPARPVDTTGLGNYLNYGIRNLVPDGETLYLGTANPMNLRTAPGDDVPEGGWELIKLTPTSS